MNTLHTLGHSNHSSSRLLELLRLHQIDAVCDVRSTPSSSWNPHFNRQPLTTTLSAANIRYIFLGKELGARPSNPACYENSKVVFSRLARTSAFLSGLDRVRKGLATHRIALLCAEREPLDCHRTILVSQQLHLSHTHLKIAHIHEDGHLESHLESLTRLARQLGLNPTQQNLFASSDSILEQACELQAQRIAWQSTPDQAHSQEFDSEVIP